MLLTADSRPPSRAHRQRRSALHAFASSHQPSCHTRVAPPHLFLCCLFLCCQHSWQRGRARLRRTLDGFRQWSAAVAARSQRATRRAHRSVNATRPRCAATPEHNLRTALRLRADTAHSRACCKSAASRRRLMPARLDSRCKPSRRTAEARPSIFAWHSRDPRVDLALVLCYPTHVLPARPRRSAL